MLYVLRIQHNTVTTWLRKKKERERSYSPAFSKDKHHSWNIQIHFQAGTLQMRFLPVPFRVKWLLALFPLNIKIASLDKVVSSKGVHVKNEEFL